MVVLRLLLLVAAFATTFPRGVHAQSPPAQGWTAARFTPLAEQVRASGADVTLLEGLPHQLVEHSSYLSERVRAGGGAVEIGGYYFYGKPLPLSPADAEALRTVCADPETFGAYSGPKRCGGFHPDYALRWGRGRRAVYTLVCFGCHETQTLDGKRCLLSDLPGPTFRRLKTLLDRRHAQRPPYQKG